MCVSVLFLGVNTGELYVQCAGVTWGDVCLTAFSETGLALNQLENHSVREAEMSNSIGL